MGEGVPEWEEGFDVENLLPSQVDEVIQDIRQEIAQLQQAIAHEQQQLGLWQEMIERDMQNLPEEVRAGMERAKIRIANRVANASADLDGAKSDLEICKSYSRLDAKHE